MPKQRRLPGHWSFSSVSLASKCPLAAWHKYNGHAPEVPKHELSEEGSRFHELVRDSLTAGQDTVVIDGRSISLGWLVKGHEGVRFEHRDEFEIDGERCVVIIDLLRYGSTVDWKMGRAEVVRPEYKQQALWYAYCILARTPDYAPGGGLSHYLYWLRYGSTSLVGTWTFSDLPVMEESIRRQIAEAKAIALLPKAPKPRPSSFCMFCDWPSCEIVAPTKVTNAEDASVLAGAYVRALAEVAATERILRVYTDEHGNIPLPDGQMVGWSASTKTVIDEGAVFDALCAHQGPCVDCKPRMLKAFRADVRAIKKQARENEMLTAAVHIDPVGTRRFGVVKQEETE